MCGRFTQTASPEVIAQQFELTDPPLFTPRYNIAPSQPIAAIRIDPDSTTRTLVMLRWGLIPSWSKNPKIGNQCINAKAETVAEKPSFRSAFKKRRCLVIADGFYEWQRQGAHKQPMWIGRRYKQPFAFAGLWEHWQPAEGDVIESCTIITTVPNELMTSIHNRMPVILAPASYHQWLDPTFQQVEPLKALLRPYSSEELTAYPVSTLVSSVPAYAEWVLVAKSKDGMTVGDQSYLSTKGKHEYDCDGERERTLTFTDFYDHMGNGKVVYSNSGEGTWEPVQPDSIGQTLWKLACAKH